ncbi:MAG: hypothetical protein ACI4JM_03625 [Oscillospiraceae bacterium]
MDKNKESNESKALIISTVSTLLLSVAVIISVTGFFISKIKKNKAYIEKWKDYDECGLS